MKKTSSLKSYRGKNRIFLAVTGAPGISRLYIWNQDKGEYIPPEKAKPYCARRYNYSMGKKKRLFAFFNTLDEARLWQRGETAQENTEELKNNCSPTLGEVIDRWKQEAWTLLAENTIIQYGKSLPFFDALLEMPIESISPRDVDDLIASWKGRAQGYRKSRTSFLKEFETLTVIFRWYQKNYDDAKLVFPFKERHQKQILLKKSDKSKRRHMTEEECTRFLSALKEEGQVFYVLGLTQLKQMMRISETCAMKWSHIDSKENTYTLHEHVVWPRIGGKPAYLAAGTKNIKSGEVYTLNLFQEVIDEILKLPKHPGCDLIFHDSGQLLEYRAIQYRYNKAFKAAGLPFNSTHVLRHSGSTAFYNATGDLLALQQMGTWSDSRMPQHYAKIMSSRSKEAIKKIEAASKMAPVLKLIKSK